MFTFHPGVALRSHAGATRKGRASSHPGCILRRMRCQEATPALIEACEGSQHARPLAAVQEPGALLSVIHAVSASSSCAGTGGRSEEHTSELQSLMRISYAVFCLKKKKIRQTHYSAQSKIT